MQPTPLTRAAIEVAVRILERRAGREAAERQQRRGKMRVVSGGKRKGQAA